MSTINSKPSEAEKIIDIICSLLKPEQLKVFIIEGLNNHTYSLKDQLMNNYGTKYLKPHHKVNYEIKFASFVCAHRHLIPKKSDIFLNQLHRELNDLFVSSKPQNKFISLIQKNLEIIFGFIIAAIRGLIEWLIGSKN